ncbi:MAG: hypothetical protein BWX72_01577 [Firmicutes bacterium ADurb.Bin080]|nr:MAG: hypothetical protein BWX72_01577 [Firmicutes bacterium ADurb.Bin080]
MTEMEKNLDIWKNAFHMLSREDLYGQDIFELSEMIMSIEHAISYTEGCRFLLLCFGNQGSSDRAKTIIQGLENYLQQIKDVHRFKANEKKRKENFLRGANV